MTLREEADRLLDKSIDRLERYTNNSEEVTEIVNDIRRACSLLEEELENERLQRLADEERNA